ncbi:MAG: 2-oxo-4-hydroxy-4-carboxy-5-ureidoimidazoline decarboxylase [Alphaproteobacteria bacterium]|nr:2-oxo-4-hydroxy-4-carboxy-5-ureidoimidazoline decarboxylase [Alphaproteobacteria bacterium]
MRLGALNEANRAAFVAALGAIFEHSPWVAESAFSARPFASVEALGAAMTAAVRAAPAEAQMALLRAHPELAGAAARAGEMTSSSADEQRIAGLLSLSEAELARFRRLNAAYRERFGFPFIIAVRRHTKESLLLAFEMRLRHDRNIEIENALGEVFAIARLRLEAIVVE